MPTWHVKIERVVEVEANTRDEAINEANNEAGSGDLVIGTPVLVNWRGGVDSDGNPCIYLNSYHCDECNEDWEGTWSCGCNDRCPECNAELTPVSTVDVE